MAGQGEYIHIWSYIKTAQSMKSRDMQKLLCAPPLRVRKDFLGTLQQCSGSQLQGLTLSAEVSSSILCLSLQLQRKPRATKAIPDSCVS